MELLLILTYTAICVAIFKLFNIPLNKWSVPTAALGGVVLIGALFVVMNYNHPYAAISREYFVTTPIVPVVTGTVIEVPVLPMAKLKQDDILFKIDPIPFQNKVDSLTAQIAMAYQREGCTGYIHQADNPDRRSCNRPVRTRSHDRSCSD